MKERVNLRTIINCIIVLIYMYPISLSKFFVCFTKRIIGKIIAKLVNEK